jgi:Predicted kinase related to dihydroxyacetone kinase
LTASLRIVRRGIQGPALPERKGKDMLEYKFDTQLLIEGHDLSEDGINDYIQANIPGDCLLAVGDEDLIKIHFHTNIPWKVLEYCASLGDIFDVVVENMERQEAGLEG